MSVQTITCQGLKELLAGESDVALVDVRTGAEFRSVHVVGAILFGGSLQQVQLFWEGVSTP